jgi:hypothetical protein
MAVSFASAGRARAGKFDGSRVSRVGKLAGNPSFVTRERIPGFETAV